MHIALSLVYLQGTNFCDGDIAVNAIKNYGFMFRLTFLIISLR